MKWEREPEFTTANRAERCRVGDYELVAFDLPAGRAGQREIGWEVFGPPRRQRLLARGDSKTFDDAKLAAEIAFGKLQRLMYRGVTKLGAEKAPDGRDRVMVTQQIEPEFIGANCAERARVGDYELVVFDLPADRAGPAVIGWELFGPPRHQELIDHGAAAIIIVGLVAAVIAWA